MIDLVIDQRRRDLGGFEVGRVLPYAPRRMVGPFIFFDHMGPAQFQAGLPRSADVRPHPHIGLSTVTYLFEGAITHRDSVLYLNPGSAGPRRFQFPITFAVLHIANGQPTAEIVELEVSPS